MLLKHQQLLGLSLDDDCNEDYIKNLLQLVGGACPVADLVDQVEKRNRTKLTFNWLEDRIKEGNGTSNSQCYGLYLH